MGSRIEKRLKGRDYTSPNAPAGIAAVAVDSSSIRVSCGNSIDPEVSPAEAVSGVAAYQWQYSDNGIAWLALADTAVSNYTHSGLDGSQTVHYRVRAMDLAGNLSEFSESVNATTLPVETTNRPPVWNTTTIPVFAYPGQTVSQATAGYASDPDGDTLEFSEAPTLVLSEVGLSIDANGLLSGTIPADAVPQVLTANISVSDGEYTVELTGGLVVTILDDADVDADWLARSEGDGVFWACNFEEWKRGIPGYVSQPVLGYPTGQLGRRTTTIADISEVPSGESATLSREKYSGDVGDGRGRMYLDTIAGVSGKVLKQRRGWQFPNDPPADGSADYPVLPWAWVPLDYADPIEGTGQPNERNGIAGTVGADSVLPFVDTEVLGTAVASDNPANRPMVRHFYCQWIVWMGEDLAYWRPRTWAQPPMITGVAKASRAQKQVFVNGGLGGGQFAIGMNENIGALRAIYTSGTSFGGQALTRTVLRQSLDFHHPSINDGGQPLPTSGDSAEVYMRRYGPSRQALVYGTSLRVDGVAVTPIDRWYPPQDSFVGGTANYAAANRITNAARNYPYGGWQTDGTKPYPLMGWSDAVTAGMIRVNRPHVVEILYTAQVKAPVNVTTRVRSQPTPQGPCFIACWAAPLGEAPQLLWQSGNGNNNSYYPDLVPSHALHRASGTYETTDADDATLFKDQDNSTSEDRSNCGYMVVGALDGFPAPTNQVFYVLRANPSGPLEGPYVHSPTNKLVDPGAMQGWGDYMGMGWARGDLRYLAAPEWAAQEWQFIMEKTEYTSQIITVPNAYQDGAVNVTGYVHKVTMLDPLPAVPRAREVGYVGDCINVNFTVDQLRPLGREIGYGEIIFSMKPIPFPGHLGTALAMPWRT